MTKQKKHFIFKKLNFLFLLFGTIFGCQTTEDIIEKEHDSNIKVTILRKPDIEYKKNLFTKLNRINQELTNAKVVFNNMFNFSIDTDLCKMVESNGITTYTFAVKREQPNDLFENLILKEMPNGTFSCKLIQYNISDNEKQQILNGIDVDLTNRINTITINDQNFITNLTSKIYYNPNACYDVNIVTVPGQTCPEGHTYGQTCYYAIEGSNYYNPSLAPTPPSQQLVYTEIDCEVSGGGSSGGSGTGGTVEDGFGGGSGGGSTSPVDLSPKDLLIKQFKKQLTDGTNGTPNQSGCFNSLTDADRTALENLFSTEFDENCGVTPSTQEEQFDLIEELMSELCNGSKIDFENKIILDPTFQNNQKAMCVYNKMKTNNSFNKVLEPFNGNDPEAFIKFKAEILDCDTRAETVSPDSNQIITIKFNSSTTCENGISKQPNLMIAQTMVHEVLHAEFFRQIIKAMNCENYIADYDVIVNALQNSDYQRLAEYVRTKSDWSHNYMADHFRKTIARVTQEFDTNTPVNGDPNELYMVLAWRGLNFANIPYNPLTTGVIAWMNLQVGTQTYINNTINTYVNSNLNQTCQ